MLLPCRTCAGRFRLLLLFFILFSQRKARGHSFPCPPRSGAPLSVRRWGPCALLPAPSAASPLLPGCRQGAFPLFPPCTPRPSFVCELSEPFFRPASHKRPPSAIRQNLFPAPFGNPQHLRTLHPVFSSSFDIRRNRNFDRIPPAWEPSGTAESGTLHGNKRRCALLRKPDKQAARPLPLCDASSDRFMRTLTLPSFPASFSLPASPPQSIL